MRWTLPVLALTLGALTAGSAGAASPAPRTLAVAPGPIAAFAQDGGRIAWFGWTPHAACRGRVYVRRASGGPTTGLPATRSTTCRWSVFSSPVELALSGTRAVWTLRAAGNITEQWMYTATLARPREQPVASLFHDTDGPGEWLTGLDGDAPAVAYASVRTRYVDEAAGRLEITGSVSSLGGVLRRIPVAELAIERGLVATAEANAVVAGTSPVARVGARVEVWDRARGPVASFTAPADIRELALDYPYVVALTSVRSARFALLQFHIPTGQLRSTATPPNARSLSADGGTAVFASGRDIVAHELGSGIRRRVAVAAAQPIGLSIDGSRVAWAENSRGSENSRGRGRIRALSFSRR